VTSIGRITASIFLCLASLIALMDFLDFRAYRDATNSIPLPPESSASIFHTYSHLPAARGATRKWRADPARAQTVLETSLVRYPLESPTWLALARMQASQESEFSASLAANLTAAVSVQPKNRAIQWRAAQVALHAGDQSLAEHHLRQWVEGDARDLSTALFIVRRWIDEPERLVDRMLPATEQHQAEAMQFAFRQRDRHLAEVVWQQAAPDQSLESPLFLTYADFLMASGEIDRLVTLWDEFDRHYRSGEVANGDFSRALGPANGLNWRSRDTDGVRIVRDTDNFYYSPASLMLDFKGSHNLRLNNPQIRIPVEGGKRYELFGFWRASALTTRSKPYVNVRALGARLSEQINVPDDTFDWQRFAIELTIPPDVRLIELSIRRDATDAFDRNIDGDLWLDGVQIKALLPDESTSSAFNSQ